MTSRVCRNFPSLTSDLTSGCDMGRMPRRRVGATEKQLSLSLSLSLTHARTHASTARYGGKYSASLAF